MMYTDRLRSFALRSFLGLLGGLTFLLISVGITSAQQFTVEDLGDLGVPFAYAEDINERGDVVGYSLEAVPGGALERAFLWLAKPVPGLGLAAGIHSLGTLSGDVSVATGVNDRLEVTGYTGYSFFGPGPFPVPPPPLPPGEPFLQPFVWSGGVMKGLPQKPEEWPEALWPRINNHGQVVGTLYGDRNGRRACSGFLWLPEPAYGYPAGLNLLEAPVGQGHADDINDSGEILGSFSKHCGRDSSAVFWLPRAAHGLPAGASVLSEASLDARGLNEHGTVVGNTIESGCPRAFVWRDGVTTLLESLPGCSDTYALDVNNRDWIVGSGGAGALLWRHGRATVLNTLIPEGSGWTLERATAVNDLGQIVGHGTLGGLPRAFLLTPIPLFADGFESGDLGGWDLSVP